MPRALATSAFGALLALLAAQAMALGIGKVDNQTLLGHPLRFAIELRLDAGESLDPDCIAIEAHAGENRILPSALRWAIEPGNSPTERTLRIASGVVIDEPVVSLNVQFTCPTRLTRKFVALVDPPTVALAGADVLPLPSAPTPMRLEPATAPVLRAVARSRAEPAPTVASAKAEPAARRAPMARPASTRTAAAATPRRAVAAAAPTAPKSGAHKTARAPAPATGSRLKLEATDHAPTREGLDLRLTSSLAAAAPVAAEAASAAEDPAAQRARERLQALEDNLAKLQAEGRATQASLAQVQQRLREAEVQRYANPLVYALGALAALLAAVLAFVLWRRPAMQGAAAPWYAPQAAAEAQVAADEWQLPTSGAASAATRHIDDAPAVETTASPMMISQAATLASEVSGAGPSAVPADPALAIEELIDLEQQAEFFVVLGQEEAAIDLLMSHLRSSGGASPLPYLKLLEIYRRRGDREASERIRDRFNRRFNAYAPEWQADPQQGRTLTDYPTAIASLQGLWATPTQAMRALEASLFRRDGATTTYDLPAYRELLLLYSVARDLAEREAPPANVDLLLPIDDAAPQAASMTRLHPSAAAAPRIDPPAEVDVDITSLDEGAALGAERASRLLTDFSATSGHMPLAVEPSSTRH